MDDIDDNGMNGGADDIEAAGAKLLEWCDYLDGGGLDRPIDAIPFELMRCHDDVAADLVGILLAIVAVDGAEKGREVIDSRLAGTGSVEVEELDEETVARNVVLAHLLSLWSEEMVHPQEPHMTLRKALMTEEGFWKPTDDDPDED